MAKKDDSMKIALRSDPIALMSPQDLQTQIDVEKEKRIILTKFITSQLKEKLDYGKIHIVSKDKCPNQYNCTIPYHFSKNSLFKAGGEKFASLFKLRSAWKKDTDTWEMLGNKSGMVCYICELYTAKNVLVGEGRGACSVEEKYGNTNSAIKISKKRAFIDAILSTGALSDFFTQDLEDMKFDDAPEQQHPKETIIQYPQENIDTTIKEAPAEKTLRDQQALSISKLATALGFKKHAIKTQVKDQTGLELKEENFGEIIGRLTVLWEEKVAAKKNGLPDAKK